MPVFSPVVFPLFDVVDGKCACGNPQCARAGKHPRVKWGADSLRAGDYQVPPYGVGYGIRTGSAPTHSGVIVIDCDSPDAIACFLSLGAIPETRIVYTPRGAHLYFQAPDFAVRNSVSSLGPGIDVRGDGGFVVGPGSPHKSGGKYELVSGEVPPAPLPAHLEDWFRKRPAASALAAQVDAVTDPHELERLAGLYVDYLRTAQPCIEGGAGDATLFGVVQRGVYDLQLPLPLVHDLIAEHYDPRCVPPWGAELAERVRHKGQDALTKSTRPRIDPGTKADAEFFEGIGKRRAEDDAPAPLDAVPTAPHFPIDALPPVLRDFAMAQAEATQVPVDLPAIIALGAVSAALTGRVDVEIRPGWVEGTNVFLCVALPPGERKSHNFSACFAPIYEAQRRKAEAAAPAIALAEAEREMLEVQQKKRKQAYAKLHDHDVDQVHATAGGPSAPGGAKIKDDLRDGAVALSGYKIPPIPQMVAADCTMERCAMILSEQGGRLTLASAEGGIFGIITGRYAKNGKESFEVLLQGHAGDPLNVDRVGRPAIFVPRPRLAMVYAVQPTIIESLGASDSMRGLGLLARFLYSIPPSGMGTRDVDPEEINAHVKARYEDLIAALASIPTPEERGDDRIPRLRLDSAARAMHTDYLRRLEPRLGPDGDLRPISDWAGKLGGAIGRLAGLLHCAQFGAAGEISLDTIKCAIALGDYFLVHALNVFGCTMNVSQSARDAESILKWVKVAKLPKFRRRTLQKNGPKPLRRTEAKARLALALETLEVAGWLTKDETWWHVHPSAL